MCFPPQSHQTSMSATEWFIRKLGIKESGPLKFYRLPSSGLTGDVAFLTSWDSSRVVVAQIKGCDRI